MDPRPRAIFGRMSGLHGLADNSLKHLIGWGDHLKVDQAQIDVQHEAIFTLAMEIADVWHDHGKVGTMRALVDKLGRILEAHFRYEESVLADIRYPKLAEHRAEHETMLREFEVLRGRLEGLNDDASVHPGPGYLVLNYLLGVTVGHIFHSDMDYCRHAREIAGNDDAAWPAS
jgi:hemerythrin-like metal-binding protein